MGEEPYYLMFVPTGVSPVSKVMLGVGGGILFFGVLAVVWLKFRKKKANADLDKTIPTKIAATTGGEGVAGAGRKERANVLGQSVAKQRKWITGIISQKRAWGKMRRRENGGGGGGNEGRGGNDGRGMSSLDCHR